jgi:excisionase family DNA binding protein
MIMATAAIVERRFLGLAAAASYASVSVPTIRRWLASGVVKSYKIGRLVRLDVSELDAAIRSRAATANEISGATG